MTLKPWLAAAALAAALTTIAAHLPRPKAMGVGILWLMPLRAIGEPTV
jgi:hypothetical protein